MTKASLFLSSVAMSAVLSTAGLTGAWETRRSYRECQGLDAASGGTPNLAGNTIFYCAIQDETDLLHPAITNLNIHVQISAGHDVWARRCVDFPFVSGGACGDQYHLSATTFSAMGVLKPAASPSSFATKWNDVGNFASIVGSINFLDNVVGFYTSNL